MNARVLLRIASSRANTATVNVWGFDMEAEYEFEEGESGIWSDVTGGHPGSPPNAQLLGCLVGGVQIIEMLKPEQIERIEDVILSELEG